MPLNPTKCPVDAAAAFIGSRNGGRDLDHHSVEYRERWPQIYDEIRTVCPVAHSSEYGGFWILSRYEDVHRVARDDDGFSSEKDGMDKGIVIPPVPTRAIPIDMDPPRMKPYRDLMTKALAPRAAKAWEPWVRNLTNHFIDKFIETGQGDLVLDIGNPVPAIFTMHFLGLPLDDWERYAMPMHQVVYASPGSQELQDAFTGIFAFMQSLKDGIAERRDNPRDDFLSVIATAEIDGERIGEQEAIEMAFLVVAGGVDTTTALLASTLDWLETHPDERATIASDPDTIPRATEEFLRYISPVQGNARTVTKSVEVGGQTFDSGDRVLLSWAAANRDPDAFENPDDMDLDRFPNRHQAFGVGQHRCAGSNVARMIFGVMLEETLRRLPDYAIDRTKAEPYGDIATVNGWKSQPVTFAPGKSEGTPFLLDGFERPS